MNKVNSKDEENFRLIQIQPQEHTFKKTKESRTGNTNKSNNVNPKKAMHNITNPFNLTDRSGKVQLRIKGNSLPHTSREDQLQHIANKLGIPLEHEGIQVLAIGRNK
jgi:allophanate hydrolase subunit 2